MADDPKPTAPDKEDWKSLRERANELAKAEGRPEPFPEPKEETKTAPYIGDEWPAEMIASAGFRQRLAEFGYTVIP